MNGNFEIRRNVDNQLLGKAPTFGSAKKKADAKKEHTGYECSVVEIRTVYTTSTLSVDDLPTTVADLRAAGVSLNSAH